MTMIAARAQPQTMAIDQSTGLVAGVFRSAGRQARPGSHSTTNQAAPAVSTTARNTGGSAVTASAQSPMNNATTAYGPWCTCVVTRPTADWPPQSSTTQAASASAVNTASGLAPASARRPDGSSSAAAPSSNGPAAGRRSFTPAIRA
jgi:hypothetical protein